MIVISEILDVNNIESYKNLLSDFQCSRGECQNHKGISSGPDVILFNRKELHEQHLTHSSNILTIEQLIGTFPLVHLLLPMK